MARRRRPGARSSVVDGQAELIIPVEAVHTADEEALAFTSLSTWLHRVDAYPAAPTACPKVSVSLDRFAFDVYFGDVAYATDTHLGDEFVDAARAHGSVAVYVAADLDPRRSKSDDFDEAARSRRLVAGLAAAFEVDMLPS